MAEQRTRATSIDVAIKAGVSQSTVSRALRGDPQVNEATRQRILSAADSLDYVVDQKASSLRLETSNTIALIVVCRPGEDRNMINPFYFSLLGSIAAAAALRQYNVLVSFQDSDDNFCADYVESKLADGVIVIGTTNNKEIWERLRTVQNRGRRIISWGGPDDQFDWVRSDNKIGGHMAAEHLLAQGRQHIAYIGQLGSSQKQFDERHDGLKSVLDENDLKLIVIEPSSALDREQQGYTAVQHLIETRTQFDGIFAACDMIALGALQSLKDSGLSIPQDVSLIGFDGIRAGCFSDPDLTTIEPDFEAAGKLLVEMALDSGKRIEMQERRIPVQLIKRGTSV